MRERPESYQFSQLFEKESTSLKKYNAKKFSPLSQEKEVLDLERENAEKKSFTISPIVSEHRGIKEQSHLYQERRLNQEVRRRVDKIEDQAFKSGHEKGVEKGRREVLEKNLDTIEKNSSLLSDLINEVLNKKSDLLSSEIDSVYTLIRNLTKWIILRELKSDDQYVYRLLEKIIVELKTKTGLLIQIDKKSFEKAPDFLNHTKEVLGKIKNVRVEVKDNMKSTGVIVTSESEIINGSLKEQFVTFDKLFSKFIPEENQEEMDSLLK